MKPLIKTVPALLGGLSFFTAAHAQQESKRPNIIFILADDMGYGDLACYGNKVVKTPNIDKLASDGIRFTNCYAGSAISSPSRCSLLTGKHTGHTTIRDNFCKAGGLPGLKGTTPIRRMHLLPNDTTIATVLGSAGYRTCLVNKWHQDGFNPGAGPLDHGFDEFYGWLISTENSNTPYYYPALRFYNRDLKVIPENENNKRGIHDSDLSVNESIDFIDRNKNNPFFLYLAFDVPHEPYFINSLEPYSNSSLSDTGKLYASLITHTDEAIGRLIDHLNKTGLRDNTIIIFASDNGGAVMAPLEELNCNAGFRGRKGILYEGGIKVPFIVNCPKHIKGGQTMKNLIYFPDVMPTLADYAHAKLPQHIDGISIKALLDGKKQNTDNRVFYWEFPGNQVAVRKGDWKIVSVKKGTKLELYNITKDPYEKTNLAEKYPEVLKDLEKEIKKSHVASPNWPIEGE